MKRRARCILHLTHRMWTPNSTSPKPSGYLHTRATPGQDGALFGRRRRRAAARVLAAAGSRAPILLRRCSAPAGAQLCRRMRLLGHPAPAGECRGLAAPLPPPHSSGTALADYAPALKLPSSASDSAAAAPGHCPRVTDLSAAARRGPKLPASATWVVTLPHPRLGQNGHSSGLRRPFGLALAPPPLTCHRSWGLGANPTDALGGPHEHGRPLPGTLRLKASLRR